MYGFFELNVRVLSIKCTGLVPKPSDSDWFGDQTPTLGFGGFGDQTPTLGFGGFGDQTPTLGFGGFGDQTPT